MPSIKVNSIAKKLGVGFKTIVEYLNEKDDSKRYNVNSKLTTDQLRDVVNEYGNELPKEERKKLLDSYTEDSAPASDAKETTASEKEVKEKENPRQEKTPVSYTHLGCVVDTATTHTHHSTYRVDTLVVTLHCYLGLFEREVPEVQDRKSVV